MADEQHAASVLRQKAIFEDYLATKFDDANNKLTSALALCEDKANCSSSLRARLHCDLGVVDFAQQKPDDGRAQFQAALKEDPTVVIDHDLSTPEVEKELAEVRKALGIAAPPPGASNADKESASAPPTKESASRDGATDCPPGFPGCHDEKSDTDETPSDQPPADGPYKRSWISASFEVDAMLVPAADDACRGGAGYACFFDDGTYYSGNPVKGADDALNGGIQVATMRVLLGYDYAALPNLTLGARLGYAFRGGPQRPGESAFMPIHLEARVSYWLGHNPLARAGFRPYLTLSGGLAEIDAEVPVDVYNSLADFEANPKKQTDLQAWKKAGMGFAGLGLGLMYALTAESGFFLEVRGMQLFPTAVPALSAQVGYAFGL
jgi:hypothetical protein